MAMMVMVMMVNMMVVVLVTTSCWPALAQQPTIIKPPLSIIVGVGNNDGDDFDQDALLCSFMMANDLYLPNFFLVRAAISNTR